MPVPGDTLISRATIADGAGLPILGESFTLVGYDPTGIALVGAAVVELGSGVYEFQVPTSISSPIGSYYLQATSLTVPVQVKEFEWLVKPIGTPERWNPGDWVSDFITVIDPDGVPVSGVEFEIVAFNTLGKQISIPPPREIGNGAYLVTFKTSRFDPPGAYYVQAKAVSTIPTQMYEVTFVIGQPTVHTGGITLRELRRMVMSRFGDLILCAATQDSDSSTFVDEDNLVGEPGKYAGREVRFVTGMNAGQQRRVVGSSRDASRIQFNRPLPFPVLTGDEMDVTNAHGIGLTFQAVDAAINWAVRTARDRAHIPFSYRVDLWPGDTIPIPVEAIGINEVYAIDSYGNQHDIHPAHSRQNGWMIDKASRVILINGYQGQRVSGMNIVVNARALPSLLLDEDDVTLLDLEWLIDSATSHICMDTLSARQPQGDWASKGLYYANRAKEIQSRLTPPYGPNYTAVL